MLSPGNATEHRSTDLPSTHGNLLYRVRLSLLTEVKGLGFRAPEAMSSRGCSLVRRGAEEGKDASLFPWPRSEWVGEKFRV